MTDGMTVAPGGVLRVAIAVGPALSAMWATRDPATGRPCGVTVDLGAALAERLGLPLALVEHASSGAVIAAATSDTWDVAFAPVDAERKKVVAFGPNYALGRSTYMVPAGSSVQRLAEVDVPGTRIFGVEGTATLRSARRRLTRTEALGVPGLDEAVARFAAGEIDALALGEESIRSLLPRFPGARMLADSIHETGTAVALPLGRPEALRIVSDLIEDLKRDGSVRRAFDRHGMAEAVVAPPGSVS